MREFFRGWKRKVGLMALTMTLPFLLGWVRSIMLADFVGMFHGDTTDCFVSHGGILTFERLMRRSPGDLPAETTGEFDGFRSKTVITVTQPLTPAPRRMYWGSHRLNWYNEMIGVRTGVVDVSWLDFDIDWQMGRGRFQMLTASDQSYRAIKIATPYWLLVIPMTMFSACLLLSKQSAVKQSDARRKDQA